MSTAMLAEVFPVLRDEKPNLIIKQVERAYLRFDKAYAKREAKPEACARALHGLKNAERAYADLHPFDPPSRKLLLRVKRGDRPGHVPPPREYEARTPEQQKALDQLEFHKRVVAAMGGSRTVAPAPGAKLGNIPSFTAAQMPAARTELTSDWRSSPVRRRQLTELGKVREYDTDMFAILDAFGSFEKYGETLK